MELEKQHYLDELAELVNIDSVSSEPEGAGKIAAFMKGKYESLGWLVEEVRLSPTIAPCLRIVNRETDHYDVLVLAHMDTVFPLGTAAKRPFRVEGNRAYGPGVIDCKAGMLSGFYALANLMYYALVIMRKQRTVFFVYAAAAVAAFFLSGGLVGAFGINGAALCYLLLMAGETAGFGFCTVRSCRSEEKEIRQ